jgi:hypothetical protein
MGESRGKVSGRIAFAVFTALLTLVVVEVVTYAG